MNFKHLLLPLAAGLACYAQTATAQSTVTPRTSSSKSLVFIENKGQVTDQFHSPRTDIDFKLSGGNGLNIFFGKGKIHYQWSAISPSPKTSGASRASATEVFEHVDNAVAEVLESVVIEPVELFSCEAKMYRVDVELLNASPNPEIITENQQPFYKRYFQPWINTTNSNEGVKANAYKKITYKDIYPNIDWVFYFNAKGQLEHDFIVHPGGKVSDIQIKYSGATNLQLNPNGSLTAYSPMGIITENAPYSTEQSGREVASSFQLDNDILSFAVADYSGILVIDPIVEWGTYFGSDDTDLPFDINTDKYGNVYMTGGTGSTANIATTGAFQTTYGGGTSGSGGDAFLTKWDMEGNLLWATYYGGDKVDVAKGVGCDTSGNVYMGGYTNGGTGISTTGSFQETKAGTAARYDAFLVKFDSSGQRAWGTYFGGAQNEASTSFSLACDQFDNIYITGNTQSNSEVATAGVHQTVYGGGQDGFIAKFNTAGNLDWATYIGGSGDDLPSGITSDTIGNIYLVGKTKSTTGISTIGAHQINNAGNDDAFLCKLKDNGQLEWSTYFGGSNIDWGNAIALGDGKIFIGGTTNSLDGIATNSGHQSIIGDNGGDGFIAAFDFSGQLEWATYYGGEKADAIMGIGYLGNDELYISGQTNSPNGIATAGSYQDMLIGTASDLFLVKFNVLGEQQWGTYYGGTESESYGYLTTGRDKSVYLSGSTNSAAGIATTNGYNNSLNGDYDAFLVRFNVCEAPDLPSAISGSIEVCENSTQVYSVLMDNDAESYTWMLPNGWSGASDNNAIGLIVGGNDGMIKVVAISECGGRSDTQELAITVLPIPHPEIINNNNILSTKQSYPTYQWNKNGLAIPDANQSTYLVEANGSYSVTVTNANNCENTSDTTTITDIVRILEVEDLAQIRLYPNPTKNQIQIQSSIVTSAEIYSIEGKLLDERIQITPGINKLDISHLTSGVYFLKFRSENGQRTTKKFVVE